jgi:hypothetical protein
MAKAKKRMGSSRKRSRQNNNAPSVPNSSSDRVGYTRLDARMRQISSYLEGWGRTLIG